VKKRPPKAHEEHEGKRIQPQKKRKDFNWGSDLWDLSACPVLEGTKFKFTNPKPS